MVQDMPELGTGLEPAWPNPVSRYDSKKILDQYQLTFNLPPVPRPLAVGACCGA